MSVMLLFFLSVLYCFFSLFLCIYVLLSVLINVFWLTPLVFVFGWMKTGNCRSCNIVGTLYFFWFTVLMIKMKKKIDTLKRINRHTPLWCIEQSPCGRGVCSVWTTWRSHGEPGTRCTGWTWGEWEKLIDPSVSVHLRLHMCLCVCVSTYLEGLV